MIYDIIKTRWSKKHVFTKGRGLPFDSYPKSVFFSKEEALLLVSTLKNTFLLREYPFLLVSTLKNTLLLREYPFLLRWTTNVCFLLREYPFLLRWIVLTQSLAYFSLYLHRLLYSPRQTIQVTKISHISLIKHQVFSLYLMFY